MAGRRGFTQQGELLKLVGDTFSIKEELKKLGARYDGGQKCWFVGSADQTLKKLEFLGFLPIPSAPSQPTQVSEGQRDELQTPAPSNDATWSVAQFTLFVERIIKQHLNFDFWIVGEISSIKSSSGHIYFDLTEPENSGENSIAFTGRAVSVSCCLWAGKARLLADKLAECPLADGIRVKLKVNCDFRKEGSRFSLIVNDIDPQFTLGDLALKRQQIVRELKRRGLYDRQRTLCPWPALPLRIALITAAGSRAQTDFLNELVLSHIPFRITLYDCLMQGERVQDTVTTALKHIEQDAVENFDCIVITRGGGSRLDLRWFDDLEICKAISYSSLPVMTAIGHFEDVSIADEVAAVAEKTPTGAARFLVQRVLAGFERQLALLERAARQAQQRILREKQIIERTELRFEQSARLRLGRESDKLSTAERALRLVQNTTARPLRMGYSLIRARRTGTTTADKHLTADDFLTSAPPERVEVELWSKAKNAQVLIEMKIEHIHAPNPQLAHSGASKEHPHSSFTSDQGSHGK